MVVVIATALVTIRAVMTRILTRSGYARQRSLGLVVSGQVNIVKIAPRIMIVQPAAYEMY